MKIQCSRVLKSSPHMQIRMTITENLFCSLPLDLHDCLTKKVPKHVIKFEECDKLIMTTLYCTSGIFFISYANEDDCYRGNVKNAMTKTMSEHIFKVMV